MTPSIRRRRRRNATIVAALMLAAWAARWELSSSHPAGSRPARLRPLAAAAARSTAAASLSPPSPARRPDRAVPENIDPDRTGKAIRDRQFAEVVASFAAEWAQADPRAAMDWARALSPEDGRNEAMERAFNRWSNEDSAAAAQWLGHNLGDPAADRLIADFIGDLPVFETDPRLAANWAELISDPALRRRSLLPVIAHWARQDPAGVVEYLSTTSRLSDDDRTELWKRLTPP